MKTFALKFLDVMHICIMQYNPSMQWSHMTTKYKYFLLFNFVQPQQKHKNKLKAMGKKSTALKTFKWQLTLKYHLSFDVNA